MKKTIFRIVSVVLLIAVMATIFGFSSQVAEDSGDTSGRITKKICQNFYPNYKKKTASEKKKIEEKVDFPVRKAAHFSLFFLLGAFAFLSVVTYDKLKLYLRALLSIGFCILYAVSDELHQYFVSGRACRVTDMLIDTLGSAAAILILLLISAKIFKRREEKIEQ